MGKVFKKIAGLGALGGLAYGGLKLKQQYDYLKDIYNDVIMFTGERIVYDDVFEGDSIAVIASGLEIDMSEMVMDADLVNLDIYGLGAGIRIIVPEGIHVVHSGSNKGSGIDVNVAEYENDDILTLNVNYDLTGCGLMIMTKYDDYEEILDEEEEDAIEVNESDEVSVDEMTEDPQDETYNDPSFESVNTEATEGQE